MFKNSAWQVIYQASTSDTSVPPAEETALQLYVTTCKDHKFNLIC